MSLFSVLRRHPTQEAEETFVVLKNLAKNIQTDSCGNTADAIIKSPFWGGKINKIGTLEYNGNEYS